MRDKGEGAKGGTLGGQKEPENLTIATSRAHNTTHTQAENTNNVGKAAFLVADYFGPGSTGGGGGDIEALQSDKSRVQLPVNLLSHGVLV